MNTYDYPAGADTAHAPWNQPSGVCPPCAAEDARARLTSLAEDCGCAWSDTLRDAADELAEAAMEDARKDDVTYCNRHEPKREDYD